MYAVLDDSLVKRNGIYVYAHALVAETGLPQAIAFTGSKGEVYRKEEEIRRFLEEHLRDELFACNHYLTQEYTSIIPLVTMFIGRNSQLPKRLHDLHVRADQLARRTAWQTLDRMLNEHAS